MAIGDAVVVRRHITVVTVGIAEILTELLKCVVLRRSIR